MTPSPPLFFPAAPTDEEKEEEAGSVGLKGQECPGRRGPRVSNIYIVGEEGKIVGAFNKPLPRKIDLLPASSFFNIVVLYVQDPFRPKD